MHLQTELKQGLEAGLGIPGCGGRSWGSNGILSLTSRAGQAGFTSTSES